MKKYFRNTQNRLFNQKGEIATIFTLIGIGILALGALIGSWATQYGPLKTRGEAGGGFSVTSSVSSYQENGNILRVAVTLKNNTMGEVYAKAILQSNSASLVNPPQVRVSNLVQFLRGQSKTFVMGLSVTDQWEDEWRQNCSEQSTAPSIAAEVGYALSNSNQQMTGTTLEVPCPPTPTPTTAASTPTEAAGPTSTPTPTSAAGLTVSCTVSLKDGPNGNEITSANVGDDVWIVVEGSTDPQQDVIRSYKLITNGSDPPNSITQGPFSPGNQFGPDKYKRTYSADGQYTVRLEVTYDDPGGGSSICEDEKGITIGSGNGGTSDKPDLKIEMFVPSPSPPVLGQGARFKIKVKNQGGVESGSYDFKLSIYDDETSALVEEWSGVKSSLAAGSQTPEFLIPSVNSWQVPDEPKRYRVRVEVDFDNKIEEDVEFNNVEEIILDLRPNTDTASITGWVTVVANGNAYNLVRVALKDNVTEAVRSDVILDQSTSSNSRNQYTFSNLVEGRKYWVGVQVFNEGVPTAISDASRDCPGEGSPGNRSCGVVASDNATQDFTIILPPAAGFPTCGEPTISPPPPQAEVDVITHTFNITDDIGLDECSIFVEKVNSQYSVSDAGYFTGLEAECSVQWAPYSNPDGVYHYQTKVKDTDGNETICDEGDYCIGESCLGLPAGADANGDGVEGNIWDWNYFLDHYGELTPQGFINGVTGARIYAAMQGT